MAEYYPIMDKNLTRLSESVSFDIENLKKLGSDFENSLKIKFSDFGALLE